ncbi:MAG TPA: hypothetical protein VFP36_08590, partial [Usitatibacter sp.]|nr:hypothetical protein [Usitatibacter sp.]
MHAHFARLRGAALLALLASTLASAQTVPGPPDRVFSAGPLQMQDGQSVAFGMLVPAVQKARSAALFTLTDSQGTTLFSMAPTPGRLSTIRVTFHAAGSAT